MPDHLHLCLEGTQPQSDLRDFCRRMRRRSSSSCWQFVRESLWQNGYHDRILRDGEDVRGVLSYILLNPVRAGLVQQPGDYPHSWSVTFIP